MGMIIQKNTEFTMVSEHKRFPKTTQCKAKQNQEFMLKH